MTQTLVAANLNERVYDELKTRLLTRQEPAGAKLSLHMLAAELGVSRSPVHHALTRLVSEGLLTVRPRRGYYVAPVTARAIAEGYDVRLALELLAAERAIPDLSGGQIARFVELLEATDAAISHEEWDATNAAFHEYQVDLAGNALLSSVYRELSVNLMMQVLRGGHVEGHGHLVTEHRRIVDAFAEGDVAAAQRAIREHIEVGRHIALDAIERAGGVL
jgi:DNA-binding GntR family transcriptional regulator